MNVCVWTDSDRFAGTERHCLELAEGLRAQGVGVVLGCREETPLQQRAQQMDLETELMDASRFPLKCLDSIQRLLRSGRVDVLHTHNGVTTALGAWARRGLRRGTLVATQHFIQPARSKRSGVGARVLGRVQRWNERRVNRWVAVSRAVRSAMLERGDAEECRISTVPNGLNGPGLQEKDREASRLTLGFGAETVIVCPARLEEEKDHRTLLHAFAMLSAEEFDYRAFCVGEGALRPNLEARARELQISDRVSFVGYQEGAQEWIRAADLVVLASPAEPFGLVLLEAMSRGVAVLAADSGGPGEILAGGAGGVFIPGDPRDLARKMWDLGRDAAARAQLARAGFLRWEQAYTRGRMVDSLREVYEIAARTPGTP